MKKKNLQKETEGVKSETPGAEEPAKATEAKQNEVTGELERIQSILLNLTVLPQNIDGLRSRLEQVDQLKNRLKVEKSKIKTALAPQKRFDDQQVLGEEKATLKPHQRLIERLTLSNLTIKGLEVEQIISNLRENLKKAIGDRELELKQYSFEMKANSELYVRKNGKRIIERIAKALAQIEDTEEGKKEILTLSQHIEAGDHDGALSQLDSMLKAYNKEIYILSTGIKRFSELVFPEAAPEFTYIQKLTSLDSIQRFFPKAVNDTNESPKLTSSTESVQKFAPEINNHPTEQGASQDTNSNFKKKENYAK